MTEHLSTKDVDRYRERVLSPTELLAIDDHIAACPGCCSLLASGHELRTMFGSFQVAIREDSAIVPAEPRTVTGEGEVTLLRAFWLRVSSGVLSRPHRVAFAAAAVLLIGMLIWWLYEIATKTDSPRSEPVLTRESSPKPEEPSPGPRGDPDDPGSPNPLLPHIGAGGHTGRPAMPVLEFRDGENRVTLDAEGNLTGLESLAEARRQEIRLVLSKQQIEEPELVARLVTTAGGPRGANEPESELKLLSPFATVIESDRPIFRWRKPGDEGKCTVQVFDSHYDLVMSSDAISGEEWTGPAALRRGVIYSWQVTPVKSGQAPVPPRTGSGTSRAITPQARFRVMSQVELDRLSQEKALCRGSHLALGLLYARAGVLDKAEAELAELSAANQDSPVIEKLLHNIRAWRSTK